MNPKLLLDPRLSFIALLAAVVSGLTTLNVAARPAALATRMVASAFAVAQLFFMVTRFANLFYLPLLASYVDRAERTGEVEVLFGQIQWVVAGAALGALGAWLALPTFIELYRRGIGALEGRGSMFRVLAGLLRPRVWGAVLGSVRLPSMLGVRLFHLEGVPAGFLLSNVGATAVWTVGAVCALYASATVPEFEATAILLSGLVNGLAAVVFTVWVDPTAAVITDQALKGKVPERHVWITAVHLSAGNVVGACLGMAVLRPGITLIEGATRALGALGEDLVEGLWLVAVLNVLVVLLASTSVVSRVSAVLTGDVATALAVYNLFFLVTRLAQQVYAPVLGAVRDHVVFMKTIPVEALVPMFRWILLGGTGGAVLGWLLMPTFVEVYNRIVRGLHRLDGSVPRLAWEALHPRRWPALAGCLRAPGLMGVRLADVRALPQGFLWGNVLVFGIHTVGVMAAIYAGAELDQELARTATLLSSIVNGVATITMTVVVDPMAALITDRCVRGDQPGRDIYAMAVALIAGMVAGTLLAQALFEPAAWLIREGARLIGRFF